MRSLARAASTFSSLSSDITGMRTPRRLDFLPLEVNQLPISSVTAQPESSSALAARTRQRRATRLFILFRRLGGRGLGSRSRGGARRGGGGRGSECFGRRRCGHGAITGRAAILEEVVHRLGAAAQAVRRFRIG